MAVVLNSQHYPYISGVLTFHLNGGDDVDGGSGWVMRQPRALCEKNI